ncbi:hypothetical protein TNIN_59891, partial [Trichonephila inaurata madagascariensis]
MLWHKFEAMTFRLPQPLGAWKGCLKPIHSSSDTP